MLLLVLIRSAAARAASIALPAIAFRISIAPVWPQTAKRNAQAFAVVDVGATAAPLYNARGGGFG